MSLIFFSIPIPLIVIDYLNKSYTSDGFISAVALLTAYKIEPKVKDFILLTHMSEEPGMKVVLNELGEKAFLNMEMRLGEGTGAVLTYPMIDCALDMINGMKTPSEVYDLFK